MYELMDRYYRGCIDSYIGLGGEVADVTRMKWASHTNCCGSLLFGSHYMNVI